MKMLYLLLCLLGFHSYEWIMGVKNEKVYKCKGCGKYIIGKLS
jgi:hypothetical protein